MKKIILFSLLALTACKKETPQPIGETPTAGKEYKFEVTGNYGGQMLWIKKGSSIPDSVINFPFHSINIKKGDSVIVSDQMGSMHNIKFFLDNKVVLDTMLNVYFQYKYGI
jgi:hypothetical protein